MPKEIILDMPKARFEWETLPIKFKPSTLPKKEIIRMLTEALPGAAAERRLIRKQLKELGMPDFKVKTYKGHVFG